MWTAQHNTSESTPAMNVVCLGRARRRAGAHQWRRGGGGRGRRCTSAGLADAPGAAGLHRRAGCRGAAVPAGAR